MKEFGSEKIIFNKITAVRAQTIFHLYGFCICMIVPLWADPLLPQLLMEQFDILQLQYRHIEHMHEEVWFGKKNYKMTAVRT